MPGPVILSAAKDLSVAFGDSRATSNAEPIRLQLHRKIHNRANRNAGRPFRQPRTAFINPACRGDVEMDPRRVLGEFLDEPRAR